MFRQTEGERERQKKAQKTFGSRAFRLRRDCLPTAVDGNQRWTPTELNSAVDGRFRGTGNTL